MAYQLTASQADTEQHLLLLNQDYRLCGLLTAVEAVMTSCWYFVSCKWNLCYLLYSLKSLWDFELTHIICSQNAYYRREVQ